MSSTASFQTRARAIDHLGRGQIADCPTAITELWKNSYDAYARNASLHVFENSPTLAAVFDDGCGMTRDDIEGRWLVVGTESKADGHVVRDEDRLGLPERPRLGEKGIGRLSAGFLAPVTLVVTKKRDGTFTAVLVDWRLFENPFLLISDIALPIEEFDSLHDLLDRVPTMVSSIHKNLTASLVNDKEVAARIRLAWKKYSEQETKNGVDTTTQDRIKAFTGNDVIREEHLADWSVYSGESDHGTALFLIDLHRELTVWVDQSVAQDDLEAAKAKDDLQSTLTGFTDPDAKNMQDFAFSFEVHQIRSRRIVIDSGQQLSSDWLRSLEHYFEGSFAADGRFSGTAKVFGEDRGPFKMKATISDMLDKNGHSRVGPFDLRIATFEVDPKNSTHDSTTVESLIKRANAFSGMMVYRDGTRVLPYGRPQSDFFSLEERRSRHAGREFWAHRRTFGRVLLTREHNPHLRDKAGREGLVDNRARRLMQQLVIQVLMEAARRFYGTDSPIGGVERPKVAALNARGRESQSEARKHRRKDFLRGLRKATKEIPEVETQLETLDGELRKAVTSKNVTKLLDILARAELVEGTLETLSLPPFPKGLNEKEEDYRNTRDQLGSLGERVQEIIAHASEKAGEFKRAEPAEIVEEFRQKQIAKLKARIKQHTQELASSTDQLTMKWRHDLEHQLNEFCSTTSTCIEEVISGKTATWGMSAIENEYGRFLSSTLGHSESVHRAMALLLAGIDLDSALAITDEGQLSANDKVQQLSLLAQAGIAVELVGHELEEMAQEVDGNLRRLSEPCRNTTPFKRAYVAFTSLIDRFRFLSPLSVAAYRARQEITGKEIATYVEEFFARRLHSSNVRFEATDRFHAIRISDVPSRIFPAFINLVNNSLYWLKFVDDRTIRFDQVDGLVVVADSGPGVDPDDVGSLFEMFFTKRPQGRGIGLYLCKANLAVARHTIRYASATDPHILAGANFIIEFRGQMDG